MLSHSPAARRVAGLLVVLVAGCSRRPPGPAGQDTSEPGAADDALVGAYCITDVQADPRTYHFDSPRWVLDAAEGYGPRVLSLTVAGQAEPLVSTTMSQPPPKPDNLSTAVGYSVGEFYFVQATAAYTLDDERSFARLEAYINYARATWVVREAGCGVILGQGVSFKPIGVYFAVRRGSDTTVDGTNVVTLLPDCAGGQCGYAPALPTAADPTDADPEDAGARDAGAADAGARDAGAADAGAADAGAADADPEDAGARDAGARDAGAADAGGGDAGGDAGGA